MVGRSSDYRRVGRYTVVGQFRIHTGFPCDDQRLDYTSLFAAAALAAAVQPTRNVYLHGRGYRLVGRICGGPRVRLPVAGLDSAALVAVPGHERSSSFRRVREVCRTRRTSHAALRLPRNSGNAARASADVVFTRNLPQLHDGLGVAGRVA
ncbi:hypothetical protein Snoj_39140 [Streptomyces nojiriensis]|uniref:Uncharacterized protein n=1 Tax=Streptomyces nojiriensis TaxID=66374 RepID=A0ABQ3SPD7_9ACTN|nr:hypothetical protein GCM10010205_07790 [Streptomyces nojiriensis]GHI69996.1 hypothetical protein Snoj_39140 [Streptomyces nojiriensis]